MCSRTRSAHVTQKHTLKAIQKSKAIGLGAKATRKEVVTQAANQGYEILLENNFDRGDEMEADKIGVTLANGAGYSPAGLSAFLTRLADRNKALKERSGIFASHPETKARIDALAKVVSSGKLASAATVSARYAQSISYTPVPVSSVAQAMAAARRSDPAARARWASPVGLGSRPREIQRPDRVVGRFARRQSRSRCEGRSRQDARRRQRHGGGDRGVPKGNRQLAPWCPTPART